MSSKLFITFAVYGYKQLDENLQVANTIFFISVLSQITSKNGKHMLELAYALNVFLGFTDIPVQGHNSTSSKTH